MSRLHNRCFLSFLALAASVAAQRTWVVSAVGGPGVDFTDIPPAVAAAANGDILDVRRGSYGPLSLFAKGLSVIGQAGVTVQNLTVKSLSATQRAVVTDVLVVGPILLPYDNPGVQRCQGPVLFERVTFGANLNGLILDAVDVRVSESQSVRPFSVARSHVLLTDTELRDTNTTSPSAPMLELSSSTVTMSRCTVIGQSQGTGRSFANPALRLADAVVLATDDGSNVIAAGTSVSFPQPSAVVGSGTFIRDPRVRLTAGAAPPVNGPTEIVRAIPALRALGATVGNNVQVELSGASGEVFALVLGLPEPPIPLPPFGGDIGLSPLVVVTQGVFTPTPIALSLRVGPGLPQGFAFSWQAIAGDTQGGWQLSNYATYARTR